ncbi:peptidoglycan-binding protein [Streptomyces sp. NPDC050400]|uniref:peptidoglycan-binding protein n=1 Tax=Streptomyces sp. NPDC050400 TaxID=3365610 RepID=UPI0037BCBF4D
MPSSHGFRRTLRRAATPLTAVALALGISATMATPASASNSYNGNQFMNGSGTAFKDDWNDEGIVAEFGGYNRNSNVTCLWQKIVFWADSSTGHRDQIDGYFGHNTTLATYAWQSTYMGPAAADGVVGKATWAAAGTRLRDTDGDGTVDKYDGRYRDIAISRVNGVYHFADADGNDRMANYDARTCTII